MGAYVLTLASQALQPGGLFLLAPAFYLPGYDNQDPVPSSPNVMVIHGWNDELIPCENIMRFGARHDATVVFTAGDHCLLSALPKIGALFDSFLVQHLPRAHRGDAADDVLGTGREAFRRLEQDYVEQNGLPGHPPRRK